MLFYRILHMDNVGRTEKTYIHQLCDDTGCSLEQWTIGTDGEKGISIPCNQHNLIGMMMMMIGFVKRKFIVQELHMAFILGMHLLF